MTFWLTLAVCLLGFAVTAQSTVERNLARLALLVVMILAAVDSGPGEGVSTRPGWEVTR